MVVPPGVLVNVQVPVAGKWFKITLPDPTAQFGCVMVPRDGVPGGTGWEMITTLAEEPEVQVDTPSLTV